jgi:hypothetical protein
LIGLELFGSSVGKLRRGNEVGRDFLQLKIHSRPLLRHYGNRCSEQKSPSNYKAFCN